MDWSLDKITQYTSLEIRANQIVSGFISGLHKSPYHGFSVEFADYRPYNNGESTRFIDWKLYARTDKLFIKNYQQETNLRTLMVIDSSTSMRFPFNKKNLSFDNPDKFVFSVYAASAIISMLYKQRDAFATALVSDKIEQITPFKSSYIHKRYVFSILENMLNKLYKDFTKGSDLPTLLHQISETIHKRSLVCIFSDLLYDDYEQFVLALEHLKHNKHEVIVFHVIDKELEQELDFKNRPYKFIDSETNQVVKLNPSQIKDKYKALMNDRFINLRNICNNLRMDYVACDINQSYNQVLLPYFYKRSRLY